MNKVTRFIVMYFIRKKLNLKLYERFRFVNQKNKNDYYYFSETELMKVSYESVGCGLPIKSSCSLNWLLSDEIRIYTYGVN